MSTQVVHESEQTRQHARYHIPACLRINAVDYKINEWSVSGLSASGIPLDIGSQHQHHAHLEFDFDGFNFSAAIDIEILRYQDSGEMGCRFINLSKQNLSLIHHIINAFLEGQTVNAGEFIHIAGRDSFEKKHEETSEADQTGWFKRTQRAITRTLKRLLLFSIFGLLLAFVLYTAYQRLFIIEALSAKIQGQIIVLRAPNDGFFHTAIPHTTQYTDNGLLLGTLQLVNGGASSIEAPCDCHLLNTHVTDNIFIAKGEPLFTLAPKQPNLYIEAQIDFEHIAHLSTGDRAEIRLLNGDIRFGTVQKVIAHARSENLQSSPLKRPTAQSTEYAAAIITPDETLPLTLLDHVVTVSINTFKQADFDLP